METRRKFDEESPPALRRVCGNQINGDDDNALYHQENIQQDSRGRFGCDGGARHSRACG